MNDNRVPSPLTESKKRAAIKARDRAYDGRFVYAVVTTGVYCRPSCAARPARPENIRFYDDNAAAEAAGYRACQRCRPDEPAYDVARMTALARYIETYADERLTLGRLADEAGLSPSRLQKQFKSVFGISPKAYQDAVRRQGLKAALQKGDRVTDAIFDQGYSSTSRVLGEAAHSIGMTPSAYRSGGAGETIYWACRDSALGPLMMAATARGVCFAQFGDDEASLLDTLTSEFPKAEVVPSTAGSDLDRWIEALDAHLSAHAPRPELPLDLRGTAFQILVWRFLMSVKTGEVVSYSDVARGVGKPRAVRAAASACGANRIAVLVPCHRVLRADGNIGGYRWGLPRKRALLDAERGQR